MSTPEISVVVPVYNEEGNVEALYAELRLAMDPLNREYEIVFVDDGSTDYTFPKLQSLLEHGHIRIIKFDKNYGQTAAQDAGMRSAKGKLIATIDGDRQNDPSISKSSTMNLCMFR